MKKQKKIFIIFLNILIFTQSLYAIEAAPRISDREIIESLAELKSEFKSSQRAIEQGFDAIDQRFDGIDQRFVSMDKSINHRFDAIDHRFSAITQQFETMEKNSNNNFNRMWNLMYIIISGIFGLIGFIVWDRKTALRPLEKRMDTLEKDIQHDLELHYEKGSLMTRLLQSLRDLAKHDEKLADILRSYSLL